MPFPTNWLQLWIDLPETGQRNNAGTWLQWFLHETPIPADWDDQTFSDDVIAWFLRGFGGLLQGGQSITVIGGRFYYGDFFPSSGVYLFPHVQQFYPVSDLLPTTQNVVIERWCNSFDPKKRRSFQICGVDPGDVSKNNLTPAALARWQAACDTMQFGFASQGITYTPIQVSYRYGIYQPVSKYRVKPRLGCLRRRRHSHKDGWTLDPAPINPPV